MLDKPEISSPTQETIREISVQSDIETFPDQPKPKDIRIKLGPDGFPKAVAFFDIDKSLAECGFIHYEAYKKLFSSIFPNEDPDEMASVCLDGISLGTTFRVFHRMIGIYRDKKEEWKEPQKYLEWLHQGHEKEVDEKGEDHELAAKLSIEGSQMAAEIAEEMFRRDPQIFEQTRIKPVFYLVKLYQRLGIPMMVMTANDEPFAKAICKCLGFADSFITMACQKDFQGGKDEAMDYLIEKLKGKGIPVPKNLIVVGDSLNGDIGSGAKFMEKHRDHKVKGVLVVEGKEDGREKEEVEAAKEKIKKDPLLKNMPVEVLMPKAAGYDKEGVPNLAGYRRKYDTKP